MAHCSSESARAAIIVAVVACIAAGYGIHLNGGSLDFTDTDAMIVVSGSMAGEPRDHEIPTIPAGSLILIREASSDPDGFYGSLRVGDVLTFGYTHHASGERMTVTHRIAGIEEDSGVYTYTLKGDTAADDPTNGSVQTVTSDSGDILGKVVGVSGWLGAMAVFMSTWTGRLCLIVIPCAILMASEVRSLLRMEEEPSIQSEDSPPPGRTGVRPSRRERRGRMSEERDRRGWVIVILLLLLLLVCLLPSGG